jgi:hypothetical protein
MAISRVDQFCENILKLKDVFELNLFCTKEIEYLNDACGSVGSLKRYYTIYRNYFKQHISEYTYIGNKPLLDHLLSIFKLNVEQRKIFETFKNVERAQSQSNLRKIYDVDNYIKTSIELLESNSIYERIIALCALTGRRSAEIGCTARFFKTEIDNVVLFDGQLKVKDRDDVKPYKIPVLCDSSKIINCLKTIREDKPEYLNQAETFNSKTSKELSLRVKKYLGGFVQDTIRVKDLRAIYATIAYDNYCKNHFSKDEYITTSINGYFSQILGHGIHDVVTSISYQDFCIKPIQ